MAEADELCDRIAIVHKGRILASGTSAELKHRVQSEAIFRVELDRLERGISAIAHVPGGVKAPGAGSDDSHPDRQHAAINLVVAEGAAPGPVERNMSGRGSRLLGLQ